MKVEEAAKYFSVERFDKDSAPILKLLFVRICCVAVMLSRKKNAADLVLAMSARKSFG